MSWSVSGFGRPAKVVQSIAEGIARGKCPEPEEAAKQKVGAILAELLAAFPANFVVRVEASGSQYAPDSTKPTEVSNSLSVTLQPLGTMD